MGIEDDKRIFYYRVFNPNNGIVENIQNGIRMTESEFINFAKTNNIIPNEPLPSITVPQNLKLKIDNTEVPFKQTNVSTIPQVTTTQPNTKTSSDISTKSFNLSGMTSIFEKIQNFVKDNVILAVLGVIAVVFIARLK